MEILLFRKDELNNAFLLIGVRVFGVIVGIGIMGGKYEDSISFGIMGFPD